LIAAIATFALKADAWFRRGLLLMLSPDSRANLARCQAEAPLIALCRFPKPALLVLSVIWIAGGAWVLWDDLIGKLRPEELAAHATSIPPIPQGYILTSTLENVQARRRHALDLVLLPPFGLFALGCAGLCVARSVES
jgi:hypothetical protein